MFDSKHDRQNAGHVARCFQSGPDATQTPNQLLVGTTFRIPITTTATAASVPQAAQEQVQQMVKLPQTTCMVRQVTPTTLVHHAG